MAHIGFLEDGIEAIGSLGLEAAENVPVRVGGGRDRRTPEQV
ncbi:MAG: hypothetical protein ACYCUI_08800 [Vulcanimicrobiaceae bacterium]